MKGCPQTLLNNLFGRKEPKQPPPPECPAYLIEAMLTLASAMTCARWNMRDLLPEPEGTDYEVPEAQYPQDMPEQGMV